MRVFLLASTLTACTSAAIPGAAPDTGSTEDPPDAEVVTPRADASPPPSPADAAITPGPGVRELCFAGLGDPSQPLPNYDQFHPVVGSHCMGTNHQDVTGVEKVVFVGDSITEGSPPTLPTQYYRNVLTDLLRGRFGEGLEVAECAAWGARADDLLLPPHQQLLACFPGVEPKRTLVVMTVGGNDMHAIMQESMDGASHAETMASVDDVIAKLDEAVRWIKDPARFPAGSFVLFANVYEYTDGEGDLNSCPAAILDGIVGSWDAGREPYIRLEEQYMRIAVETGSDLIFLLEHFCGHGYHHGEADNECYRGPDAELWFDLTCIHPNPTGHARIAEMFDAVVGE